MAEPGAPLRLLGRGPSRGPQKTGGGPGLRVPEPRAHPPAARRPGRARCLLFRRSGTGANPDVKRRLENRDVRRERFVLAVHEGEGRDTRTEVDRHCDQDEYQEEEPDAPFDSLPDVHGVIIEDRKSVV